MKVNFLVEDDINDTELLVEAISKSNNNYKILEKNDWILKDLESFFPKDSCTIGIGSIPFCNKINRVAWYPGVIGNFYNYQYSVYANYFDNYLLNSSFKLLPYKYLCKHFETLKYPNVGMFIKSNSGLKAFTGGVFKEQKDLPKNIPDDLICVVSPETIVSSEFRFWIHHDEIVTYSQYLEKGYILNIPKNLERDPEFIACRNFINEVLQNTLWRPDDLFVMDVGIDEVSYQPKIIELNAFSTSGLYHCDYDKIIEAASSEARCEWRNNFATN